MGAAVSDNFFALVGLPPLSGRLPARRAPTERGRTNRRSALPPTRLLAQALSLDSVSVMERSPGKHNHVTRECSMRNSPVPIGRVSICQRPRAASPASSAGIGRSARPAHALAPQSFEARRQPRHRRLRPCAGRVGERAHCREVAFVHGTQGRLGSGLRGLQQVGQARRAAPVSRVEVGVERTREQVAGFARVGAFVVRHAQQNQVQRPCTIGDAPGADRVEGLGDADRLRREFDPAEGPGGAVGSVAQ